MSNHNHKTPDVAKMTFVAAVSAAVTVAALRYTEPHTAWTIAAIVNFTVIASLLDGYWCVGYLVGALIAPFAVWLLTAIDVHWTGSLGLIPLCGLVGATVNGLRPRRGPERRL